MAISGKCVSKHLYINDTDEKRKRVEVNVKIQNPCGQSFGCFASKPIKVISKPSKKRQSVKNMECKLKDNDYPLLLVFMNKQMLISFLSI